MKVAIRVDASNIIGTGHVTRCLTLAKFLRTVSCKVIFVTRELPGNLIQTIINKGYHHETLQFSDDKKKQYSKLDPTDDYAVWPGVSEAQDASDTISALSCLQIDLLVIDHYAFGEYWEKQLQPYVQKIMVIDDLANRSHCCDYLLDHNYILNRHRYDHLVPKSCVKLLGLDYCLISPTLEKIKQLREKRSNESDVLQILLFMGGVDLNNDTEKVLHKLLSSQLSHSIFHVVLGLNNPHKTSLKRNFSHCDNVVFHVQPNYYHRLLAEVDCSVGSCGVSQVERMYVGLPSIVLPVAENQRAIYNQMLKDNVVLSLDNIGCHDVRQKLMSLKKCQVSLFNPDVLLSCRDLSVRRVTMVDAKAIYQWRTDPSVMSVSNNQEPFSFDSHLKWLKKKTNSEYCVFLMFLNNDERIGVTRFDYNNEYWLVSIFLNPKWVGRGYGSKILKQSMRTLNAEVPNSKTLVADIDANNFASIKLFTNCGFLLRDNRYYRKFEEDVMV